MNYTRLKMKKRFGNQDWINIGVNALREQGADALTVEELCNTAKRTRGSFYFHFPTIGEFLVAMTEWWITEFTHKIVDQAQDITFGRLDLLNQLAARLDPALERGFRQLAARNQTINAMVRDVDKTRQLFLARLYGHSANMEKSDAEALAQIEYAALVGFQITSPELTANEAREFYQSFLLLTGRLKMNQKD